MNDTSDEYLIRFALLMWRNYIETGMTTMSARDAANAGLKGRVKVLDEDQVKLVKRLESLAEKHNG